MAHKTICAAYLCETQLVYAIKSETAFKAAYNKPTHFVEGATLVAM